MSRNFVEKSMSRAGGHIWLCLVGCFIAATLMSTSASATENGASVYPVGADTVMPGLAPPPNGTVLDEFTLFYAASRMNNSSGASAVPEFNVRVLANAIKLAHN
jgi:hypothetical protein